MPKQITQFWIGHFDNQERFTNFFSEHDNRSSRFAISQNEKFIDHDFVEIGFELGNNTVTEKFKNYSYSENWLPWFEEELKPLDIDDINTLVMCNYDGFRQHIDNPVSIIQTGINLNYIGTYIYEYEDPDWLMEILKD